MSNEEVLRLMEEGRSAALLGRPLSADTTLPAESLSSNDPSLVTATAFLQAVSAGAIETRGGLRNKQETDFFAFLDEAEKQTDIPQNAPFLKSVAAAWARFSSGRVSEDVTRRMARDCARELSRTWGLASGARLAQSILLTSLHRIDVPSQIRSAGWLDGEILRLRSHQNPNLTVWPRNASPTPLYFLEKNRNTILIKTLKSNDPHYPQRVSLALPRMIEAMHALVARMRTSSDPHVLEAADHLGGGTETGRRGNFNSLVNHAISSGRLLDYVRDVESRFASGDIIREIDADIRSGKTGRSDYLRSNKSSLISRSIHHGTLNHKPKLEKALKKIESKKNVRIENLESENRRLKSLVAELILSQRT